MVLTRCRVYNRGMLIKTAQFFSYIPLALLHLLGVALGWVVFLVSPNYRRVFLKMTGVFARHQKLSAWKLFKLRCSAISHAGMAVCELPYVWFAKGRRDPVLRVEKHNWHFIDDAVAKGQGVLFVTPHLGCFELCAQKIAVQYPLTALYRPHKKPAVQALIEASRERGHLSLAPADMSGVRKLLRALKKCELVGLLPDQVPSNGEGIWAPFFGLPAYTMSLPVKLHATTNALFVMVVCERLSFGRGYIMHCYPGPTGLPEDVVEASTLLNKAIEDLIIQFPAQYLWGYNRYKLPKGVQANGSAVH